MSDPDDDDLDLIEVEPDDPDAWRDCAEDAESGRDEAFDHNGFLRV